MRYAFVALVAACRGTPSPPAGCQVTLSGNLVESIASPKSCPSLVAGAGATQGDVLLKFTVPSRTLGASFSIDLDLGPAPTPGVYNAGTTAVWSAAGVKAVPPAGACMFLAGNNATPAGDFVVDLTSVDRVSAHGTLALTLFVLPRTSDTGAQTDCGRGTTERVQIQF